MIIMVLMIGLNQKETTKTRVWFFVWSAVFDVDDVVVVVVAAVSDFKLSRRLPIPLSCVSACVSLTVGGQRQAAGKQACARATWSFVRVRA